MNNSGVTNELQVDYEVLHQLSVPTLLEMVEITGFLSSQLGEYSDTPEFI